jgi:hypothetical protein
LITQLQALLQTATYCRALVEVLLCSMFKRFNGLLQLVDFKTTAHPHFVPEECSPGVTFNDHFYLLAPLLDPTLKTSWVQYCCPHLSEEEQNVLKEKIQNLAADELRAIDTGCSTVAAVDKASLSVNVDVGEQPNPKKMKLLSFKNLYKAPPQVPKSAALELHLYLSSEEQEDINKYWVAHASQFPKLASLVKRVLCVVASGSPVERIFSVAGNFMHPRRSRMNDSTLSCLIFLKCNSHTFTTL